MGNSQKEQLDGNLNIIRQMAKSAQERLESPDAVLEFTLARFDNMAKKLCDDTVPQIERLLGEVDRLEKEAKNDQIIAATDRASAEHRLEGVVSMSKTINIQSATNQSVAADAATEAALQEKEEAVENARLLQIQYEEAIRERESANQIAQDLRALTSNFEQQLESSRAEIETLKSSALRESHPLARRSAAEADLSSTEPGNRHASKWPSVSTLAAQAFGSIGGVSDAPLHTRGSRLPRPIAPGVSTGPKRPGVLTRKSMTASAPAEESTPSQGEIIRRLGDVFNMLELPTEWDQNQRSMFQALYSGMRNNTPEAQMDILKGVAQKACS